MKALFLTTTTNDCLNHVRAWESAFGPAGHITYRHLAIRNDQPIIERVRESNPDVIFYIGACEAPGNPRPETLRLLKVMAPLVSLCSDAADRPWHKSLMGYRNRACFSLQVAIDGAKDAPVDHATLTPVDATAFEGNSERDIRCGFSGTVGRWNERSEIVRALAWFGGLTVRDRIKGDHYAEHVAFIKRCAMLFNMSRTGTGHANHIKGRVLEAGWAGCCLLESAGSPIGEWFPRGCWIEYRDPPEAAAIIRDLDDRTITETAARLSEEVRSKYTARLIYQGILDRVAHPVTVAAA